MTEYKLENGKPLPKFCTFPKSAKEKAEARVAVAKDVIKWLHMGRYKPEAMNGYIVPIGPHDVFEKTHKKVAEKCNVCAMGAAMLSSLRLFDGDGFWFAMELGDSEEINRQLRGLFSRSQLRLIEVAFECWGKWSDSDAERKAFAFGDEFRNPHTRLLAIMQNIVDHGGTFKPSVLYEEVV